MPTEEKSIDAPRKPTHETRLRREDNDIPLGGDADTMNPVKSSSGECQNEEDFKRSSNGDDVSSFRGNAPSTAISTCSNVSTGQLIPSSGNDTEYNTHT